MASNEDAFREERLRRRREGDRLRRQTETPEERDARLKLTVQLHVSEALLHRLIRCSDYGYS